MSTLKTLSTAFIYNKQVRSQGSGQEEYYIVLINRQGLLTFCCHIDAENRASMSRDVSLSFCLFSIEEHNLSFEYRMTPDTELILASLLISELTLQASIAQL